MPDDTTTLAPLPGLPPPSLPAAACVCRIDNEWVADATVRGGRARFINHSCDPNCYTKIFTIDGTRKIGIYAKKAIAPGEELAYDYKVSSTLTVVAAAPPACMCWHGSGGCLGVACLVLNLVLLPAAPAEPGCAACCTCCLLCLLLLAVHQFDFEEESRKVPCACGAKNCRGFMN